MINSREVLLGLVRMAMGWESDYSLPNGIDWEEVMEISHEQGVAAIVLDGYEVYLKRNPQEKSFLGTPEYKPLRAKVFGRLNSIENRYRSHLSALVLLSNCFSEKGLPFLIMKGFSCARYYPFPNHRGCGDIDIYPGRYYSDSNEALEASGFDVDPHYYRHSVSVIQDVTIENHRVLCDLRGPKRQTREFEKQLEELALLSIDSNPDVIIDNLPIAGARYPSANFNALFLPWHVSAHFGFERVTIRHLLDWSLFLVHEGKNIDVDLFRAAKQKYTFGFSKIADILTCLALRFLNIPTEDIPMGILEDAAAFDNRLADRVFDYMFVGQPRKRDANVWKFRLNNVKRVWQERWKYKDIYGISVAAFLAQKVYGVFFKVGEDE